MMTPLKRMPALFIVALLCTVTSAQELDTNFPQANGPVHTLAVHDSVLFIGGAFTEVGGLPRQNLAAIHRLTGEVLPWAPEADSTVQDIAPSGDGRIYVCGSFQHINGAARNTLGAVNYPQATVSGWNPEITFPGIPGFQSGMISAVEVAGSQVFIAGYFLSVEGQGRNNLAALDTTGALLPWNPGVDLPVEGMRIFDNLAYLYGPFSSPHSSFAAIDIQTGIATGWNPQPNNPGNTMGPVVKEGNALFIAGFFTKLGDSTRIRLAKVNDTDGVALPWDAGFNPNASVSVRALAIGNGALYVGGDYDFAAGLDRRNLASFDPLSGQLFEWSPKPNAPVTCLLAADNYLYAGGFFTEASGESRNHLAAYRLPPSSLSRVEKANPLSAFPNPASDVVYIKVPDGRYRVQLFDSRGQQLRQFEREVTERMQLNVEGLPPGVYGLRLINGTGHWAGWIMAGE